MEAAYICVYLWKAMVEKAGSFDVEKVKAAADAGGITFDAPEGLVTVDGATQHIVQDRPDRQDRRRTA